MKTLTSNLMSRVVQVLSPGSPFRYNIPSFDLLEVKMWHLVKSRNTLQIEKHYDMFECNHSAINLDRVHPVWMKIKDGQVSLYPSHPSEA